MSIVKIITLVLILLNSSMPGQNENTDKKFDSISIFDFYDSSHHWYDINDEGRMITPLPNQYRYKPTEITKIADNILLYQKTNGGWPKNYDMLAILTDEQKEAVLKAKNELNTTFDNGATHSQIEYLVKVYAVTQEEKFRAACENGINFILSAQYPNGGWSQFYPDTSGYRKYITFNDGAMMGLVNLFYNVVTNNPQYSFIDQKLRKRITNAFNKALDCILNCQIKENGKLTVWCQQHDNKNLKPRNARTFEPACICNGESTDIVSFLMRINNPDQKIINSIQGAVKWFADSEILGIKVQEIAAPKVSYQYHTTSMDRVVVQDEKAPPIWTRYYELGTHKPLFCNRDGKPVYSLSEVDRERRTGYSWYTYAPQEVLSQYPDWQKKWAPENNVLK